MSNTFLGQGLPAGSILLANGDMQNADGSVDHDNGNGTYTETEKNGTITVYTNNGIPFNAAAGDKIAYDAQGNQAVQTPLASGGYIETDADGSQTTYDQSGNVVTTVAKAVTVKKAGQPNPASSLSSLIIPAVLIISIVGIGFYIYHASRKK